MNKSEKNKVVNWINIIAFGVLLLGGLNFLLMGMFGFDMYAEIFGGIKSVAARVFYSLFGLSAVTLVVIILWKAFMGAKTKSAPKKAIAEKTSAESKPATQSKTA